VARLSSQIARKLSARSTSFEVALDPIGLGRVDVKVQIGAGGLMQASMHFDSPQSAEALRSRAGELRASLEQAGFQLGDSGLSFTAGDSGGQSERGGRSASPGRFANLAQGDEPTAAAPPANYASRSADGRLDIRI
jgi:flagellar hook-length control protein FliK